MNDDFILNLGQEAIKIGIFLAGPMLLVAMVVGIAISIFQAVTQINESTLTFIPKMVAIVVVLIVAGPWMLEMITNYTTDLFTHLPDYIR